MDQNIGRIISEKYRIIRQLGQGAFGSAYLASNLLSDSQVVIKITHEKGSDYETKAFEREAMASARVRDRNIVSVIEAGTTEDGYGYIVREYIEGKGLDQLLRQAGSLQLGFAVRITLATGSKSPPVALLAVTAIVATLAWVKWGTRYELLGIVVGVLYAVSGLSVAALLRRQLKARRSAM